MKPGALLYNAGAGSASDLSATELAAELESRGLAVRTVEIEAGDDPSEAARLAVRDGVPFLVVAGGDGTVGAVASVLIGTETPLGVIALGTFNNFALSLDLPEDPVEACELIGEQNVRGVDVGFANGKPFFECAGLGLDAEVFPLGEEIKSGAFPKWITLFRKAFRYRRQNFEIEFDRPVSEAIVEDQGGNEATKARKLRRLNRKTIRMRALMLTVSNGQYYGMNFTVAPKARIDDGLLTINVFKRFSRFELWWHFLSISSGRRIFSPKTLQFQVAKINITGRKAVRTHLDGQVFDQWPVAIELRHSALQVFGRRQGEPSKPIVTKP
jgi:diacylglycerol kinase (ATP)